MVLNKNVYGRPDLILRLGLAFAFTYAAISALKNPGDWLIYLPNFLAGKSSATALMKLFAIYELVLAAWLLSGRYLKYAASLCALTLFGAVVSQPHLFSITFRDVGLIAAALALAVISKQK